MNKKLIPIISLMVFAVAMFIVAAIGTTYLFPDQSSGIVYTEYDIISIDNERFTYIDGDNKVRSIKWVNYPKFINVYPSNRTYLVIETGTNKLYRQYNLYLNVSDLQ